jgi:hypothetical protein
MSKLMNIKSLLAVTLCATMVGGAQASSKARAIPGVQSYILYYTDTHNQALAKLYGNNNSVGSWTAVTGNIYIYAGDWTGQLPLVTNPGAPTMEPYYYFPNGTLFTFYDDLLYPGGGNLVDLGGLMFSNYYIALNLFNGVLNVNTTISGNIGWRFLNDGAYDARNGSFSLLTPYDVINRLYVDLVTQDPYSGAAYYYYLADAFYNALPTGNTMQLQRDLLFVNYYLSFDKLSGFISPATAKTLTNEIIAVQGVLSN